MKTVRHVLSSCVVVALSLSVSGAQLGNTSPKHDVRVKRILDQNDIKYRINESGDYVIIFDVGDGRSQMAFINSNTETYRNFEIREIWSWAYKSDGNSFPVAVANRLLEDSGTKKLGAWSKAGKAAVFSVKVSADADGESVVSTLKAVLESADEMEKELTGKDDF